MRSLTLAALGASMVVASATVAFADCAKDDPTGSKVLAARQQASSTCPCAGTSHGAYVKCVVGVAKTLSSGANPSLPKSCKGAVKKCAAHSTCGKPGTVTCCPTSGKGMACKIKKDAAHCTKHGTVGTCTSCCDACAAPGSGPSCGTITTTTITSSTSTTAAACSSTPTGTVVKGSLTATVGRFNYNMMLGLPGANSACNTNFAGTHACSIQELQAAPATDLTCLKDTANMTVTSFWAIDSTAPGLQQCIDDAFMGSNLNWEYGTAHTPSRGVKVTLDTDGDGHADIAAGARFKLQGTYQAGSAAVWSGASGKLIRAWDGEPSDGLFGHWVMPVPDLSGDGLADVIIAAPSAPVDGLVR